MRLTDLSTPDTFQTSPSSSHKRNPAEIKTDYSDMFIQGSSSAPMEPRSPVLEGNKARKRRRLERQPLGEAEILARIQEHRTPSVLFHPGISTHTIGNSNLIVDTSTGPGATVPTACSVDSHPVSLPRPPSAALPSVQMFQGSTNFKIENSVLTNAQGNVTIYRFDLGGPPSQEFKSLFEQHVAGLIRVQDLDKKMTRHRLSQVIRDLPCAKAAYNNYTSSNLRHVACFEGTRQALLEEIAQWLTSIGGTRAFLLFGVAGIGKSTVAHTVAERADTLRLLGASFFFSRDEADRRNAEKFFTTIAFQLCVYDKQFSEAIGTVLTEDKGAAAALKDPQEQLRALILEPLRDITKSRLLPTVIVVDALDECDDQDALAILSGLNRLVRELPCFKVLVTTRPQPYLPRVLAEHKVFHLQDIEDKIVDDDIRRYLKHSLAWSQVAARMPLLTVQWSPTDAEIESLVQAAGRLFIMASTLVRFILDMTVHDPESQMEELKTDGRVSLDGLGHFYSVILRRAVPPNKPSMARRFTAVTGTILVVRQPLPIRILEHLTESHSANAIRAVLTNLESVITLNDDTPRIYHKSLFDFLTDPHICAGDLLIDMKDHHTRVATRCFQIMNKSLKQNILDLGAPARFMDNDEGIAADNVSPQQLAEKIPGELRYACFYWLDHIKGGDAKDVNLIKEVAIFTTEHLLHWLEALSWIKRLDIAYYAVSVLATYMKLTPGLSEIIYDALHFIPKFYRRVHRSAVHTYYSALAFTSPESHLYKRYSKEMLHGLCQLEGSPSRRDGIITAFAPGFTVLHSVFSHDSSKFASTSGSDSQPKLRLWDAENGMLLRSYHGDIPTIAGDFSVAALWKDRAVTLWSVPSNTVATIPQSEEVVKLALSFDGTRLAVALSNGTVGLWDAEKGDLIACLQGYTPDHPLEFAPGSHRLAFVSGDGAIRIWNGDDGGLITRLDHQPKKHVNFVFSEDGRRLASVLEKRTFADSLMLWDGENANFIRIKHEPTLLQISEDGSFIAAGWGKRVDLWHGDPLSHVDTLKFEGIVWSMAFSRDILAVGAHILTLYDVNKGTVIGTLGVFAANLAWSPDCTRLAVGSNYGGRLYDAPLLKGSITRFKGQDRAPVTALVFSPDASRLASGLSDGTIELWDTSRTQQPIVTHKHHASKIFSLAFSFSGELLASGSSDGSVRFWSGKDGASKRKLGRSLNDVPLSMVLSPKLLAIATISNITLFNHKSLRFVDTLEKRSQAYLSFSADGSLLASASRRGVVIMWNVAERAAMATFTTELQITTLTFSPDNSQIALTRCRDGSFELFDIVNERFLELTGREDLGWVPTNLMNGVVISWEYDELHVAYLAGKFPGRHDWIPVLWIPEEFEVREVRIGLSMLALGCGDGRIMFVRFPTTSFN